MEMVGFCDESLKDEFITKNENKEPMLYKNGVGQYVGEQLIREFACKYDCIRILKMSDKTLQKTLDLNTTYNGFNYKMLEPRILL